MVAMRVRKKPARPGCRGQTIFVKSRYQAQKPTAVPSKVAITVIFNVVMAALHISIRWKWFACSLISLLPLRWEANSSPRIGTFSACRLERSGGTYALLIHDGLSYQVALKSLHRTNSHVSRAAKCESPGLQERFKIAVRLKVTMIVHSQPPLRLNPQADFAEKRPMAVNVPEITCERRVCDATAWALA